jgi:hypothetical protein
VTPIRRTASGEVALLPGRQARALAGSPAWLRMFVRDALRDRYPAPLHGVVEECRFDLRRKWRFDLAILPEKVAVEFQGATHAGGRHTRGPGYAQDCEKTIHAVAQGWTVLPIPYDLLRGRLTETLDLIMRAVEVREARQ